MAEAWRIALSHTHEPTALILSRQAVPTLDRTKYNSAKGLEKGAYILSDCDGEPEIILIGTGSELPMVADAGEKVEGGWPSLPRGFDAELVPLRKTG